MELQKFLTTTLCSAVARVAGHITLTIAAAPPAKVEGSSPITASLLANGGVCVVAVESDHEIYPVLPKITESEILAATANNLDSDDVVGSAEKKKRASIAGIAPTPIYSLSGAVVSTKVPILPIAVGQSSSLLVTFAVPITHIQQDVLHLANLTLAFRQNGASAKSPSELVLPVIHVNTTRVEDISLHSRLRQVSVDAFSGSGHILTTGPNGLFVVKGHEVLCEGDSIRTGSAEDHASLSLITIGGTRLDLGPSTEVRIDKVTKKELVCHLLSGKLVVTTPCDQTVIVKCEGYETAVDGAATVRISFVAEPTVLYEVKTLSGRCVATNLAIAALPATPQPTPQQLPLSLQHSAAAGAGAALPKGSVEVLASRQTTTHHQPDGALSTPWLVEFTKEEVEEILGTDGNQQPQHTAPSSQRNLSGTPGALSLAALSAASPAVSARGDVSPSQVSPSLAGRLSPALSDLSVLQAAPPRAAVKLPASRGATAASKSHAALRASMVVDTIKCRFEVIRMLDVMQRKYSLRLAKFSAPQTSVVRRARTFLIGAELSFVRNRLANSVAYICSTNNALDSWRGAFEAYTHFVRLTTEDDDSTARTADGDDQRTGTPSSSGGGAGGANEKLCWWHVDDIAQMKRAIATERPLSISMPNLFETTDILEQRALVIKDKDDRRDAAKLLRLEEQLLTRQSEENRREFALIRLFQLFQWNGFETVWVKDVLSVLTTVPRAKLFLSISSRAISILEAVGVLKSLTDEQFATALGVACKDLTPAEFTAFMDLLSRRAVAVQDDVEASVESRAFYSFAQALGIGSRGPLCQVESLLELIQRNLSRRTTWTSTANVDSTSEEALQRRWDRFLDALSSTLQKLQFEVVQTPLRRKSTASMLKRSGSLLNTSNLPSTPTDTVGGGAADVMLSIIPEEEEDENGDDNNNAGGGTNKLLNKHYTELSLLTFLPAIKAFFASVPLYSDMTAQLQVLTDAADGALNKNRSFNAMIEHEEKLKQKSHLLEWERRHLFDGVSARDIVNALSMEEMPAQVHTSLDTLVAPICILTNLIPAPKVVMPNLFEGFHAGGAATANPASSTLASSTASLTEQSSTAARLIFGGGKSQKSADQIACAGAWGLLKKSISANVSGFKDKLTQFSPLSISHRAILRCAFFFLPNLFEGFHAGGAATSNPASSTLASSTASLTGGEQSSTAARLIFGGAKSQKSADQIACAGAWGLLKKSISANVSGFKDKLTQFSPLSISHRAILRCAQYLEHDDLNPQMLSPISPLLAALAKWILLFLRLTFLQHAYDAVELTVPARLLGYQQTKALNVSTEPSPTLHVVAAAVRPTSGGRRSPPRATSPSSPGATSPRSPTTASIGASGSLRPTSAAKSRVWAQACAAPSREATTTLTAMGLLGTRFAVEAPRAPTFGQKLSARPCTAGTLRQGFAEPGPLPAAFFFPCSYVWAKAIRPSKHRRHLASRVCGAWATSRLCGAPVPHPAVVSTSPTKSRRAKRSRLPPIKHCSTCAT
ncbi:Hypothetical protein, putative [Bodo saltans]|uniref:Uncharacterized protein n=1 Tax=Bodo saltans TaxID=75058 RepID=A0A0S4KL05_BODSA|nr:Hypothetical protein, putative [Bodo saltans]|eukprot:CUI14293.1 Hypothetical protein, putative [Bodo saltans]